MARQTRAQRRARRQQQDAAAESQAGLAKRAVARDERSRADGDVQVEPTRRVREHVPGGRFGRFLSESWGELKKVEWPTQNHVIQATVAVLVACIIIGFYIWVADRVFQKLVQDVLLR